MDPRETIYKVMESLINAAGEAGCLEALEEVRNLLLSERGAHHPALYIRCCLESAEILIEQMALDQAHEQLTWALQFKGQEALQLQAYLLLARKERVAGHPTLAAHSLDLGQALSGELTKKVVNPTPAL
jgi:hypothetical protein